MLKTLHWYITRELIRISTMALAVFTLLFTVIMIMEPLRKKGLATGQVAELFIYTLPAMVSFTLPFATLFAVTFTYGRFAQDRELLACRASGISTPVVLMPGIFLGIGATIISLILANFIAPASLRAAEEATIANFEAIAYHVIRKENHVKFGKYIVHATQVDQEQDRLMGVVAGQRDTEIGPDGKAIHVMQALVASEAYLKIEKLPDPNNPGEDDYYASVDLRDQVGPLTNRPGLQVVHSQIQPQGMKLDDRSQDKPSFYDWNQLLSVYRNPAQHPEIREEIDEIKRLMRYDSALDDIETVLKTGRPQMIAMSAAQQCEILAPKVKRRGAETLELLSRRTAEGELQRVRVTEFREDGTQTTVTADHGTISCDYSPFQRKASISITLTGDVRMPAEPGSDDPPRLDSWSPETMSLPPEPRIAAASAEEIYENPGKYTDDKQIMSKVANLREKSLKYRGKVYAEMHARLAFGLLGMLLVTLGAALGVILRSGQAITALVVSLGPALVGYGCLNMGQNMLSNPDSSNVAGLMVVWGSLVVMLAVDVVVYWRLRKV